MVNFNEVKKGYDKGQVDEYIKTLSKEYDELTKEHQTLLEEVEESKKDTSHKDAIVAALINAELTGKKVIEDAQMEAKRIVFEANQKVEETSKTKETVLEEIKKLSDKLIKTLEETGKEVGNGEESAGD